LSSPLEEAAKLYDEAAAELACAAEHCKVAAKHFRDGVVPRGAAHAWAALGHVREAEERLDAQARTHASQSSTD
jgi:1-aminocyclopropane-1-carboxylate deaminase/D-cysteine desulfhydrase-like pyridoxal-dependent ACC family enzyme